MSFLILDLETVTDASIWTPPPETPNAIAPTAAHQVVVVGCLLLDDAYRFVRLGLIGSGKTERERLEQLSHFIGRDRPTIVTFNGRGFDMPVIAARAMHCGVSLGWYYAPKGARYRYQEEAHLDLCDWLSDHGAARMCKLDEYARLIGLPGKVGVDGSQVGALYAEGRIAEIESYCLSDVVQTAFILLRFRLLQGRLDLHRYRTLACELVEALEKGGYAKDVIERIDESLLYVGEGPAFQQGAA